MLMTNLPEELLRLVLLKYLSSEDDPPSLDILAKRFAHACRVCSDFRDILMDTWTPEQIDVSMTFDELIEITPYLTTLRDPRAPPSRTTSVSRLFETLVGRIDLAGGTHVHQSTKIFSAALTEFSNFNNTLRTLNICAPEHWRSKESFDCQVLEEMRHLEDLKVHMFKDVVHMHALPDTLQKLDIGYGEVFDMHVLSSHGISILDLPPHLKNLKHVRVSKRGTVGVILRQLLSQASEVDIDCKYLLVAVTVKDPDGAIVTLFRNPFLEGRYIPPHVLADWDMIEASHRATDITCSQLLEQLGGQDTLRLLRIKEEADSIKVVPATPEDELNTLRWISSISEHQSQLMFGLSAAEFRDRSDLLLASKLRQRTACESLERVTIKAFENGVCEFRVATGLSGPDVPP